MSHKKLIQTVKELRRTGLSFRAIEQRIPKTLGLSKPGNGMTAFRLSKAGA